ncbi:DUF748 domain-containing protein [Azonexus sp.]|uniref:DUF748 domain-containing protein n=1 Tax=Azonexus sp. TaxID=1872668 RepID=UPI0027BAC16D|nr:DUF748 domain-containing protein [Azonexus sp.]
MTESPDTRRTLLLRVRDEMNSSRNRYFAKWFGGLLLVLVAFGFLAAPPLLKSVLNKQLGDVLQREVVLQDVKINPLALSATLGGFSVKADDGKEVAGFDELYVNLSAASLFKLAVVVDEIRLQGLRIAVTRLDDGRYDISDLLDEWMKPKDEPASGTPRFSLNNIQLIDGQIVFDDRPRGKVHTISDIQLGLPFVSSLPYQAEVLVQPMIAANINGSPFKLSGRTTPFAEAHESLLDLALDDLDLAGLQPYLPDTLPLRIDSAKLDSQLKVVFKEVSEGTYSLLVLGGAQLSDLQLAERTGQPLLAWKTLAIDVEQADLLNRNIAIRRIALDGMDMNLAVNAQGELNLVKLAEQMQAGGKPAKLVRQAGTTGTKPDVQAAEVPAQPLTWSLGEFVLNNGLVHWRDESNRQPVIGQVQQLHARVGKLDSRLVDPVEIAEAGWQLDLGERLRLEKTTLKGMRVDLPAHRVDIAELVNTGTRAALLRNTDGIIEWVASPVLKTVKEVDQGVKDTRPWLGQVEKLLVEDMALRFEDRSVQPVAIQEISGLAVQAEKIGNVPKQKAALQIKALLNQKGNLEMAGAIQLLPFDLALKVDTRGIPLTSLQGYANQFLNVELQRGLFSNQGEASLRLDQGKLKVAYQGSATLGELRAVDRENKTDFLKWKSLHFAGIDFRLDPLAIDIREIALSDFFSRLILDANGQLNVANIVRKPASVPPPEAEKADKVVSTATAGTAVQLSATSAPPSAPASASAPIRIGKVTLNNGTVNFSDYFVKPNYTVNVGKLGGSITGLSSVEGTLADMELRGSYGSSAPVQITAKLNPLAAKSYLDLKAEVKGVDLTDFSPYSGKYAGYVIDKGKLSLNLAYKLENRQLSADNQLFIDQLTFGAKVDSPDATQLPVNLAIALLRNNRGEIDLSLPISGSLDDPQFSVGGLVIKVIVNLFVKAVSSPFALLGSMFGGGEELSHVAFAPGRATLDEAGVKKLESLSKALSERAALKLEIAGLVDPAVDREGLKQVAIERAMQREKFADLQKNGSAVESPETVKIPAAEYKTYLTRAYQAAKFPKPRNVVGLQKALPVEEMEKLLLANLPASDDDLRGLARQRAELVQLWLIEQGKLAPERIFLVQSKADKDALLAGGRVNFSLR